MQFKSNSDISEAPDWLILEIDIALSAISDPSHRTHALGRVLTQYVPAVLGAQNEQAVARAWDALFRYLIARPTPRKKWAMQEHQADLAINEMKQITSKLTGNPRGK